jgi:TonB family protein
MHLVLALFFLAQAPADADSQVRDRLTRKYGGKLFTVRDVPSGTRLRFDADGKPLSPMLPGMFTLDGSLHAESINVRADRIEIVGRRSFLSFNAKSGKLEEYPTRESFRLEFSRKAGVAPDTGIDAVLLPLEEYVKGLPPYWLRLVSGAPILETITDPDTGETVPRASEAQKLTPTPIRRSAPIYPTDLQDYSISGPVVLRVIVDEKGKPKVVDIVTPMGFGLDQAAINAVNRWEYEPAKRDGMPIKVYVRVLFNFSAPR